MRFYLFNESKHEFEQQYESIYDVSDGLLENQSGTFSNDFFLDLNENTYFFRREH
jgi:hypothetical protein